MSNTVVGKVISVLPIESGVSKAGKEWKNQAFVIETAEQWPKKICFTMLDKNDKFGKIEIGMGVEVHYNLESREYNGKWYTNNPNAWKIDVTKELQQSSGLVQKEDVPEMPDVPESVCDPDLPF